MNVSQQILSDITVYLKYAKYIPELNRRETWSEIVDRNRQMHIKKFPQLKDDIERAFKLVEERKVLPSMRTCQFAGKAMETNPLRGYNCSAVAIDDIHSFSETCFALLSGAGVGVSVQKMFINKLPRIIKPNPKRIRRYVIPDSIEGWADSIKILMKSYTGNMISTINFDFSDIRPKGSMLVTSGGKAPGPQPLKECLLKITGILDNKKDGSRLTSLECFSIVCHIADAVLAGGVRRSAILTLFDLDDKEMMSAKSGSWWELNPHFGRSNNSVSLLRSKVTKEQFLELWQTIKDSNCGEPAFIWTNEYGTLNNPCVEVSLKPYQCCNLTEVNVSEIENEEDIKERVWAATFIGTLQASFTDFHYLRDIWKENCEEDSLLGVSLTGIASNQIFNYNIKELAEYTKSVNKYYSDIIGIKPAARTTVVKPSGTASLVLGTSSGIHSWHNDYYKRRIRIGKNEPIYTYLAIYHPELIEDCKSRPQDTAILTIPVKAPDNATTREESALDLLNRVEKISEDWINGGYTSGVNQNNVSCTVSIKEDEWEEVAEWMWNNRNSYTGLSILPYDGHTYIQPPFENCTKEEYESLIGNLKSIDLTKVVELHDFTDLKGELACGANGCEVK